MRFNVLIAGLCTIIIGCAGQPRGSVKSELSPTVSVTHRDFYALWNAAADAARDRMFALDRTDYRSGILTTDPMVSRQFFELWRGDAVTLDDVAESSLATVRRQAQFDFVRLTDGSYSVVPRVTVERYSTAERRLTSAAMYSTAFRKSQATGTRDSDRGIAIAARYWYPLGRDQALERALADSIQRKLPRSRIHIE